MNSSKQERNPFIDRLRVWVVLSLIPFHAALFYLKGIGYIQDNTSGYPTALCFFVFYLYHFFMDLLFVVSGYSSFHSCSKRGLGKFLTERSKKLLFIFIAGFVLICPFTAYFTGVLHNDFKGSIFSFFPEFFSRNIVHYLGWGHFWFLLYLFVISIITVPLLSRFFSKSEKNTVRPLIFIAAFLAGHLLIEAFLRPIFPSNNMLVGDYASLLSYTFSFIFGWVLAKRKDILSYVENRFKIFLVCGLIAYAGLVIIFFLSLNGNITFLKQLSVVKIGRPGQALHLVLFQMWTGLYCWSWVLFWIGFGKRVLNKKTRLLKFLSRNSFTIYIWHNVPITITAFVLYSFIINAYIKWTIVTGISFTVIILFIILFNKVSKVSVPFLKKRLTDS